jgi:uncharacterized protein with HEPN domain
MQDVGDALAREVASGSIEAYRANQALLIDILTTVADAESVRQLDALLRFAIEDAVALAPDHIEDEIEAWLSFYGAEARTINLGAVASLEVETLIERYQESLAAYGQTVANRIRDDIANGIISRESINSIVDGVRASINGEQWRAERIVRTEMMNAYNEAHYQGLLEAQRTDIPELQKSCIATFDARTDADSLPVNGQVQDLGDPFVDGDGRQYLHPPGRPNDREKEIAWLPESAAILAGNPDDVLS